MRCIAYFFCLLFFTEQANAASNNIQYGSAPSWIKPAVGKSEPSNSGAVHAEFSDVQVRIDKNGVNTYTHYKLHLLKPEALPLGNINLVWSPDSTEVTVHRLLVHRGIETIDILKDSKFRIYQREGELEQSMLDGFLTANIQIPGLRVGDAIEFATTLVQKDPTFPESTFGTLQMLPDLAEGTYRLGLSWEEGYKAKWRASDDFKPLIKSASNRIQLTLKNPGKLVIPANAPARYSTGRFIQFTDFENWTDISRKMFGLFDQASLIRNVPSLRSEIDNIARQHSSKRKRALEALALVQDSVRYVYTGMNGSNFTPATVEQTWTRRFGDCKGKTAMLLGVLRELGIDAKPVLVSSSGGDGFDEWLPSPGLFDHVLIRTNINGTQYWLDGTRQGDQRLMKDEEVGYKWVLPLSEQGGELESVKYYPPANPSKLEYVDIDATAGFAKKAKVSLAQILRGDQAHKIHQALRSQSQEAASQSLKQSFEGGWISPEQVSWQYHAPTGAIFLSVSGTAELDWDVHDSSDFGTIARYYLPGGGFYPPTKKERPATQDQTLPFINTPGSFSCSVTRIKLPELEENSWTVTARSIDQNIGGVTYYRVANLEDRIATLIRSSRTIAHEVSAAEAEKSNKMIADFDNSKAWVASAKKAEGENYDEIGDRRLPDFDTIDWVGNAWPCNSTKAATASFSRN